MSWYLGSMDYFVSYISRLDTSFNWWSGFLGSGVYSPNISGTYNGGTEPYKAILGVGVPLHILHKPYILLI